MVANVHYHGYPYYSGGPGDDESRGWRESLPEQSESRPSLWRRVKAAAGLVAVANVLTSIGFGTSLADRDEPDEPRSPRMPVTCDTMPMIVPAPSNDGTAVYSMVPDSPCDQVRLLDQSAIPTGYLAASRRFEVVCRSGRLLLIEVVGADPYGAAGEDVNSFVQADGTTLAALGALPPCDALGS